MALWIVFFVNGAVLASWAPRIPQVKSELSLTDGQMGWALLGVAAGSVPRSQAPPASCGRYLRGRYALLPLSPSPPHSP
ncbi:hypothetical protein CH293_19510 [Rhodococcus sp. 14-2470-1b]|nr:hypothetical protein CH293_19510 [Rhodococcus sp. 14-2470-1b]